MRFDSAAGQLAAQPRGLLAPRGPLLGESALCYFLTLPPAEGVTVITGGRITPLVWLALLFYFGVFALGLRLAYGLLPRPRLAAQGPSREVGGPSGRARQVGLALPARARECS